MKSFYIITGGILVMIAVVLIAPQKQNKTEEKASTPSFWRNSDLT